MPRKMHSELTVQTIVLDIVNKKKLPEVKASKDKIIEALSRRADKDLIDKTVVEQYLDVLLK